MRIFFLVSVSFCFFGIWSCSPEQLPKNSDGIENQDASTPVPDDHSGVDKKTYPDQTNEQTTPDAEFTNDAAVPESTTPQEKKVVETTPEHPNLPEKNPTENPPQDSQPTKQYWTKKTCPKPGTSEKVGTKVNNLLEDVTLVDCDDKVVKLSDFCGAKAIWFFFAHGWCPYCQQVSAMMESVQQKYEKKGVAVVNVLVEAGGYTSRTPATQALCKKWKQSNGFNKVVVLYDPKKKLNKFWEQRYTALNLFVNRNNKITAKIHTHNRTTIERNIDNALK